MLTAVGGVIIMTAIAFGFYFSMPESVLTEQPARLVELQPVDEQLENVHELYFKQKAQDILMESLELLELMEEYDPLLLANHRQRRDVNDLAPNRISRSDDLSAEVNYGVRRRVQREYDLGTLPIDYRRIVVGQPSRRTRRHAILKEDLERAKRSAQQNYQRLEREYNRCRKEAPNGKLCDQIYEKLQNLSDVLNARFLEVANLLQGFHEQGSSTGKTTATYPAVFFSTTDGAGVSTSERSTSYRQEAHAPKHDPTIATVEQLVNQMNITQSVPVEEEEDVTTPVPFDPSLHVPVENGSIRNLDDLFDHMGLGGGNSSNSSSSSSSTATPKWSSTEGYLFESDVESSTGSTRTTAKPTSPPTTKRSWTTTKSPLQIARNLHDVVDQLQLAQMLQPHPFHEDLLNPPANIDEFVMSRSRNRDHMHHDHETRPVENSADDVMRSVQQHQLHHHNLQQQQHPLVVGPSAPFLNLCDQLRSASGNTGPLKPAHTGFQAAAGIPITGEATKASSQIIVNSAYGGGYVPNTVCFYQNAPPAGTHTAFGFRPATGPYHVYPPHHGPVGYQQQQQPQPGYPAAGGKHPLNDPAIDAFIQPRIPEGV
uniref:Uncharacterized protein n=1 Tax=Anopheles farauti TaxID=69004 RepID=A0A182R0D2_9DIPT